MMINRIRDTGTTSVHSSWPNEKKIESIRKSLDDKER